jgi:hypothetical protein
VNLSTEPEIDEDHDGTDELEGSDSSDEDDGVVLEGTRDFDDHFVVNEHIDLGSRALLDLISPKALDDEVPVTKAAPVRPAASVLRATDMDWSTL